MTDQKLNQNLDLPNQVPVPEDQSIPIWKAYFDKYKPIAVNIFNKFYSNKKIFWPVVGFFGLVFLIIILGNLFGGKRTSVNILTSPSPSPIVQPTPVPTQSSDVLTNSSSKLGDLKTQIENLDVKQIRLQPPTLYFNIKF